MTQIEKDELLRQMNEQQTELLAIMAKSDAHAAKCSKLGLVFANEYPQEYAQYCEARERYNANQAYTEQIQDTPIEEPVHRPIEDEF